MELPLRYEGIAWHDESKLEADQAGHSALQRR